MLEGVYKSYRRLADEVNWKDYNVNDLFFEYIKHENDDLAEKFFAGIICRFWGYAGRIYVQCNRHVTFEECHDCIIDAARYVLKNRVWEKEGNSLFGDMKGPDKAMHIAMKRQRSIMLSRLNAYRRKTNFNTMSLDGAHESFSDSTDGMLFDEELVSSSPEIDIFISTFFSKNRYIDGLILDSICYNVNNNVDFKSVIKSIRSLDKDCFEYFDNKYSINYDLFIDAIKQISNISNKMMSIKVKALLYELRGIYK